ncbi:sigma-54-dependent Fis family transcriptional regulator [Agrobacterium tumefaciens]|uniref:sigma-54-dependent Fis family transcriptional regulator n=1 Tax=Agrobacterium tumefaciens TaxID=358 RepID=UPI0015724244|nr:sigma-54-dependent Fis family transcriptional regulator [Agrobacterium tumefaciens]MCZ7496533.1 sigma-54-dependent Fis family transcriptional regulator [Rhizobium rhizogenes]NSY99831.1 sigma-54-dependent Fis family transcriptional regulator [Agrobacterium tumefaciens]NSZ37979.1 sigma-54-dependent Fis family transcriptional regulator [Agrobacterium tumefaciens]NTB24280.1 sigma-54-dependent Fis family transcriptional regulator [Agrobacterium tumefaciens]NTB30609.1 sigma-54-dependent Fis famil
MGFSDHIKEIEHVGQGRNTGRDAVVLESWRRCLDTYQLDPAKAREAVIVSETCLREHRQRAEDLVHIARSGLERLYRQVAEQNYVLLLSDQQGVTVEFLGDPSFNNNLRKAGLYLGSEWSEPRAGTCAVGACIATGEALTIHQTDHFDVTHTPLSCTAAPIYDTQGALTAVLDISLLSSPILKTSQNMARHLVSSTVRRIELANLMASSRHDLVLRFAGAPEFLDVDPEAALSVDGSGRITGMTHAAARLLAASRGLDWRLPERLLGERVEAFFEAGFDELASLTRSSLPQERRIVVKDGTVLYAHAIEPQQHRSTVPLARPKSQPVMEEIGGDGPAVRNLRRKVEKLAPAKLSILLQGQTGTGKEHLARIIHDASGVSGRFVAVNCAAIPEQLIESELFGYLPGAFTGALAKGRKGLVEEAQGGTLFLDEIGDMPFAAQSRLLRVLAEGEILPVGGSTPQKVDFRVISASHRPLSDMVRTGDFREDLYYRLNAAVLTLPALCERDDFHWLLDRLLEKHGLPGRLLTLSNAARMLILGHSWPGNIRELDNAIAFAAALCDDGVITAEDLPDHLASATSAPMIDSRGADLGALLAACNGNVSEAARRLGIDRTTMHRRMRRLGIGKPH